MSKILYLLRHCMAMPANSGEDKARDLAPKGKNDAIALGKMMRLKDYRPNSVLCSPSARTKQTLEGLSASITIAHAQYPPDLYNGAAGAVLHHIQSADDKENTLLVVAHNPGIHQLASMLTGSGAPSLTQRLAGGFAPGMLVVLRCPFESWHSIQPGENELIDLLDPQDYNAPARPTRWM